MVCSNRRPRAISHWCIAMPMSQRQRRRLILPWPKWLAAKNRASRLHTIGTLIALVDDANAAEGCLRFGWPPAPPDPAGSPAPACIRPSGAYPYPADGQEQEHTSQRGIDIYTRVQCAAPTAPAPTARLHGRGAGRLGIEEHGAVAVVLGERINVGKVAVHKGHHRLSRIVGMFQPEHMPKFVEHDPLDIDSVSEH